MIDAMGNRLQSKDPVVTWSRRYRVLEFGFYMGKDHVDTHWVLLKHEVTPSHCLHFPVAIIKGREIIRAEKSLLELPDAKEWNKFMRIFTDV